MTTTITTTPNAMLPQLQAIVEDYKKNCGERFIQATLNKHDELVIHYKTQGGYFVSRRFLDPNKPDHYESLYFVHWNEELLRPEGFILSRLNNPK